MNILWIIAKYFDVALDKSARIGILNALEKHKISVTLLTGFRRGKLCLSDDIKLLPSIKVPILHYLSLNISIFFSSIYYLLKERVDVVICCHMSVLVCLGLKLFTNVLMKKTKYILDIRTIPVEVKGLKRKLLEVLFSLNVYLARYFFDGITVITEQMGKYISKKYKITKRLGVWSSAVDLSIFNPVNLDSAKCQKIKEIINPDDKFIIMYHGVITENRGLANVVEAINIIREKQNDINFVILGDGIAKYSLRKLVAEYNLNNFIKFIAPVPLNDVPYYISCCDIGILPFPDLIWWRVSSPLKLMEYLAMGKPVIATDIEAHKDVIGSNNCGFIIPDNKPETIADAILQAYSKKNFLKSMGENGRKLIEEKYTWDKQAENLISYINSL